MMYFLDDQGVIDILKALFSTLWSGLDDVFVPGFDFSFADVFLALFIAGLVGTIMKGLFVYFGSHFTDGKIKGKARGAKSPRAGKVKNEYFIR